VTSNQGVELVANKLVEGGYRRLSPPIILGGLPLDVQAALAGQGHRMDLVLVVESTSELEPRIVRRVEGAARALDVLGSRRSLTTVVVGPAPSPKTIQSLSRVSRVLPVGQAADTDFAVKLENWLAVLMPLSSYSVGAQVVDFETLIRRSYTGEREILDDLLKVASEGATAVARRLYEIVDGEIERTSEDEEHDR
jgi:hypothetical protein